MRWDYNIQDGDQLVKDMDQGGSGVTQQRRGCSKETERVKGSTYPGGLPRQQVVAEECLKNHHNVS
ncbi:hypothetical protein RJ641_036796 [Dillenia turbinata]|uniref:Uncharacterized protein n=1 Tax=Dillenia turbinata TaxID=194707 RepID=A0AAN8ZDL1_9MAGN